MRVVMLVIYLAHQIVFGKCILIPDLEWGSKVKNIQNTNISLPNKKKIYQHRKGTNTKTHPLPQRKYPCPEGSPGKYIEEISYWQRKVENVKLSVLSGILLMLSTRVGGDGDGAHGKLECAGRLFKGGVLAIVGHLRLLLVPQYNHLGSQGSLFMRKIIDIHEFVCFTFSHHKRNLYVGVAFVSQANPGSIHIRKILWGKYKKSCNILQIKKMIKRNIRNRPSSPQLWQWCPFDLLVSRWRSRKLGLVPSWSVCLKSWESIYPKLVSFACIGIISVPKWGHVGISENW